MLIFVMMTFLGMTGCDIHEYPAVSETTPHDVQFKFDVESMFDWENVKEWEYRDTTRSYIPSGTMRYTVRLYPLSTDGKVSTEHVQEYVLYYAVSEMYGQTFNLELLPGNYRLMAWADLEIPGSDRQFYYNPTDFSEIILARHQGNTDYRDGFRGTKDVTIYSDMYEREPELIIVDMERPLAKYEVISDDLGEFIEKMIAEALAKESGETETDGEDTKNIDLADYTVRFYYVGFMPSAYSMFSDKPVDSYTGETFDSYITKLNEKEASLGFDYVFVNGNETYVTIQVGIYDNLGAEISLTEPLKIPLYRNTKTLVKGAFLLQKASGGISINPDYENDYNIML